MNMVTSKAKEKRVNAVTQMFDDKTNTITVDIIAKICESQFDKYDPYHIVFFPETIFSKEVVDRLFDCDIINQYETTKIMGVAGFKVAVSPHIYQIIKKGSLDNKEGISWQRRNRNFLEA